MIAPVIVSLGTHTDGDDGNGGGGDGGSSGDGAQMRDIDGRTNSLFTPIHQDIDLNLQRGEGNERENNRGNH